MTSFARFDWQPWVLMWTFAVAVYISCKWLTWQKAGARDVPCWKNAAYLLAWPGMDAISFLRESSMGECSLCHSSEWFGAVGKLIVGAAVLLAIPRMIPPQHPYLTGWIGMIGIVLILHFGIFQLLSCLWRS